MTRDEIIKELRCLASGEDGEDCPSEKCDNTCPYWTEIERGTALYDDRQLCRAAADMLEQDAPGWISVKDRLPEDGTPVIALCRFASYQCGWYRMTEFTTHKSNMWHDGTARYWFPLPEPPKEEEK